MAIELINGEKIYWQAHQSTTTEVPENTMVAFEYAWNLGGIPEADIRTTKDGVIICLHDKTLERTGYNIPEEYKGIPASSITYDVISVFDVGRKYGEQYRDERVPALKKVFEAMKSQDDRLLYLDFKDVNLEKLVELIEEHDIGSKIIFAHNSHQNCTEVKNMLGSIGTMLWIGGSEESIKEKFEKTLATGFKGLDQVQLHLNDRQDKTAGWRYDLSISYLKYCYGVTQRYGIDLEVLPFEFEEEDIHMLLDTGIRWFAVDYPKRFVSCVKAYR